MKPLMLSLIAALMLAGSGIVAISNAADAPACCQNKSSCCPKASCCSGGQHSQCSLASHQH
jgi:hypothetical protein